MDAATVTVAPAELVGLFRDQAADQGEVGLVEGGRGGRGGAQPRREMVVSLTGRVGRPSAGPELLAVLELLAEFRYTFLFLPGDKFGGGAVRYHLTDPCVGTPVPCHPCCSPKADLPPWHG